MKIKHKRILALLLLAAMVIGIAPSALAVGDSAASNAESAVESNEEPAGTQEASSAETDEPRIYQSNELAQQLREAKLKKERLLAQNGDCTLEQTQDLLDTLETGPDFLDTFDADLFHELVDKIIVQSSTQIRFRLKNGLELPETIERTVR